MIYDVIIIGAGPAGLTAAIYAARRALKTLVVAKDVGGQANLASHVENFPGILSSAGIEITTKMKEQAEKFGAEIKSGEIKSISENKDVFIVKANNFKEESKAVILAFGLSPRDLGVPGEEKFKGRGVSYCAICDGPLYKNKTVAVVGGGNSALDAAFYLGKIAKKVYLIHRREGFRAEESKVCKLKETKNIELVLNAVVSEVLGDKYVSAVKISDVDAKPSTSATPSLRRYSLSESEGRVEGSKLSQNLGIPTRERKIKLDGVFVEIGYVTKVDWLKNLVKLNERNEIITDKDCKTSVPGIFAAGDITDVSYKQIIISAGEGAKAALSAYRYVTAGKNNAEMRSFDWGKCK